VLDEDEVADHNSRPSIPPGEGERRAQRGLVPQYKVAAEKILGLLTGGRLHQVGIADPKADTLDDVQTVRRQGALLILDAYQVKWSKPGETLIDSEFRSLLTDLVRGRQAVMQAARDRAEHGADPVDRVIAHLYTSDAASTASLRGTGLAGEQLAGEGRTLHAFLDAVWHPAQRGALRHLEEVDGRWHAYVRVLADRCGLDPDELLASAPDLRVELSRELAEDELDPSDWQTRDRLKDLVDIRSTLQDLVSHRDVEWVWLSAEQLVEQLGPEWKARWRPRLEHNFPTSGPYEPVAESVAGLSDALDRFDSGYVVLTGSPGAGKSTLLTRLLRADERLAARYYAYVPGGDTASRGEASSFLHDLYLAIAGRQGQRLPAPRGEGLELLRTAFAEQLEGLGRRALARGRTEILLIDGLDHVARDPKPFHPLLSELPAAEHVPDGVLLVLGTRGLADLPPHVRRSVIAGRHVELAPLDRAGVLRLCEQAGMAQLGERIAELSGGHPLLVRTYLKLVDELPDDQREAALSELPPSGGEIWDFYETIWAQLAEQPEIVELLALISRLRGPIRLSWLATTGTPAGDLTRLDRLRHLFDARDRERWRFFHSSFQEFLLNRTAEQGGRLDPDLHRVLHRSLAERCRTSPADAPERFDELHHLLEAGESQRALASATPAYFRAQVDGLRPRDEVADDLRAVAAALVDEPDGLAAARLALSAHELQVRDYQFPDDQEFLDLLVDVDLPEQAVAHLRAIDNGTSGQDRRQTAMRLAQTLADAGHGGSALRVFEEHEPLDWLGGPPSPLRDSSAGPLGGLYAWSRVAARLRGSAYVLEMVPRLRVPDDLDRFESSELPRLAAGLLWSAGDELVALGDREQAAVLRDALVACGESARTLVAMLDLSLALALPADEQAGALEALDESALPAAEAVVLGETLLDLEQRERADAAVSGRPAPELPERAGQPDAERRGWQRVFRYWRLQARLSGHADPSQAIPEPEKDYLRPVVLGARHLVVMATLEGRRRAGEAVGINEVLAALRAMHAWWDSPRDHRDDMWRPGGAVALASRRAVALAAAIGEDQLRALLDYFTERWESKAKALRFDGAELIRWLARHHVGPVSLRRALERLEVALEQDGASPRDWVALGPAWLELGEREAASRCLRRAVRVTLSPSSDKDVQLATWIRLMAPLLDGPDGHELGDRLVGALKALDRLGSGGSPDYAARALLDVLAARDPDEAWRLAEPLLGARVLRVDEVVEALLGGSADRPTATWWTIAGELLVALGVGPPRGTLAAATEANPELARDWLPVLAERVAIEGRPTERRAWRLALIEAGRAGGRSAAQIGIAPRELEISDEAPEREGRAAEAEASEPRSVSSLLADAEREELASYERADAVRKLVRRLDELDQDQLDRLVAAGERTESEGPLRARLATAAASAGDPDEAWVHGIAALRSSSSGDWSRQWGGGPILDLIPVLLELDRARARRAVYERFAELTGEVDYFLASVGQSLDNYVLALELPEVELAREALEVASALLRDIAPLPDPRSPRVSQVAETAPGDPEPAFEALVVRLLGLEQTLAWQAAQRALLELRRLGLASAALHAGLSSAPETALRTCAVVQAASVGLEEDDGLGQRLEQLIRDSRLDVRLAAAACLNALGRPVPPLGPQQQLPAALRLELPPRDQDRRVVGALEESLGFWRPQVEALARVADVDEDALHDHVLLRARDLLDGLKDIDRLRDASSFLGWGYVKPSARAIRVALAEAAAELVDARRVSAGGALRAVELHPPLDTGLLEHRSARRPAAVATFIARNERHRLYSRELSELAAGADDRLARHHEGWVVLGEDSEVDVLDRPGHHEVRRSGVVRTDAVETSSPHQTLVPLTMREYRDLARSGLVDQGIVRPFAAPAATPTGWLAVHPGLANSVGLTLDESGGLDWTLNGQSAVRSLWWRSGYLRWNPYSSDDEVGEGWLVLGSREFVERLRARGWELDYEVLTVRRGDGDYEGQTMRARGRLELPSG
jgi:hypothetical protein